MISGLLSSIDLQRRKKSTVYFTVESQLHIKDMILCNWIDFYHAKPHFFLLITTVTITQDTTTTIIANAIQNEAHPPPGERKEKGKRHRVSLFQCSNASNDIPRKEEGGKSLW